jgi:ATP-dependent DNA helicase RecQ
VSCGNCDKCVAPAPLLALTRTSTVKNKAVATSTDKNFNPELFEVLRQVRTNEAARLGVPPYIIFGDKALRDMASKRPQTDEDFLSISGVGDKKLAKFGELFMGAIRDF